MVSFLSSWVKNLCLALIVVSILEMILLIIRQKNMSKWLWGCIFYFHLNGQ